MTAPIASREAVVGQSSTLTWRVVPCVAANLIASLGVWLQPSTFDGLRRGLGLSEASAGLLAGTEIAAIPLVSILLGMKMHRVPFTLRTIALFGCSLVVAGNILSMLSDYFSVLVVARFAAGVGQGCLLAAATAVLVRTVPPSKIGFVVAAYILCVAPILLFAPSVVGPYAHRGAFGLMAALTILLTPIVAALPGRRPSIVTASTSTFSSTRGRALLIASILWATSWGFLWAFSIELGQASGFNLGEMGIISGASVVLSALGSMSESLMSNRIQRLRLLTAVISIQSLSIISVIALKNPVVFGAGILLVSFFANFTYPQLLRVAVEADPVGGLSAMIAGSFFFSGIASPIVGGFLLSLTGTYAAISIFTAVSLVFIIGLLALALRTNSPAAARLPT